ncbi:hypothetical protein EV586_10240 [Tumebacillus sp. BK434]|uniref:hypothetical protein n=1 Tax=Tumebacillus sp. BK434 TaxID=2512169 RepID=UPI00104B7682|nr:hypothetical protein [Tumebacillus sp. BK434]TCP57596.1 hypothetical protein EV586_10240 [Tumebacillus sp. BK434]
MEKTTKLVSLFTATVLVAGTLAGCGDDDTVAQQSQKPPLEEGVCYDDDDNGYCDDSDREIDHSYGFIYIGSHKRYYQKGYYPGTDGKVYRKPGTSTSTGSTSTGTGKNAATTKPNANTPTPPKSSSGTGTVVSPGKSSSGVKTGVSSGSKGGIGSSSKSSSS